MTRTIGFKMQSISLKKMDRGNNCSMAAQGLGDLQILSLNVVIGEEEGILLP